MARRPGHRRRICDRPTTDLRTLLGHLQAGIEPPDGAGTLGWSFGEHPNLRSDGVAEWSADDGDARIDLP